MKLDKIKFAELVRYISGLQPEYDLDLYRLDTLVDIDVEPVVIRPDNEAIEHLMRLMAEGTSKIEAIRAYRSLTGMELKESKDAVEKYWVAKNHEGATLGYIP